MSSITKTKKERDFHHLSTPWNITFNLIAGIFAFLCVFPFLFVVIISFTDEVALARDGYKLIPAKWSLGAYRYVFESGDMLLRSYGVTIFVTVIGTIISLLFIAFYAYAISRKSFRYRNFSRSSRFLPCCSTVDLCRLILSLRSF